MSKDLKILVASSDPSYFAQLDPLFAGYATERLAPDDIPVEFDRISPDFVLMVHSDKENTVEAIQYMVSLNPQVRVAVVARSQNFELLREVTRAGAIDFFVLPEEMTLLHNRMPLILQQVEQLKKSEQETSASVFKKGRGQIYSFYSAKGGSGKTLIAANFAQTLKLESTANVLLIDLNLQYGGIETLFSIDSARSLADLQPVVEELNEGHIHNVTEREPHSQLEILLSPADGEIAEKVTDQFIASLLRVCRRNFDFVIVDLPTEMNAVTYTAMEEADRIFYVLTPDTPSIRTFKKAETLFFRLGMNTNERLRMIYNRIGNHSELQPKDMDEFVSYPVEMVVRQDIKGLQSPLNKGEPLRKTANEKKIPPFAKDIQKWVHGLIT
ncbi:hypothetical protein J31TS4_44810 [Paenibacillus sp. J31TS4]|uniref:AAA family ATPase n=1 Tax=Paenibacillus sp. J31TS4 TaxID=2807195 RepID=UPI001B0C9358|nr:AAA family ATPase [Paenibacillus sp. J31TS4]GIP41201.1 hypothetical protein J31TS4_44810 [Paenibacillus sp. J31TS4]